MTSAQKVAYHLIFRWNRDSGGAGTLEKNHKTPFGRWHLVMQVAFPLVAVGALPAVALKRPDCGARYGP